MYTKKSLIHKGKWPFSESLLDANVRAGVLPAGKLRVGKKVFTDEEADQIEQAVKDDKILPFRVAYAQATAA